MRSSVVLLAVATAIVGFTPGRQAAFARQAAPVKTDQKGALAQIVHGYHARGEFDGVVLIARHGKIIYEIGTGMADRAHGIPNRPDTPYRICSITKQFTALLVMQLVQEGKLKLDGFVTDYLPDFRADTGSKITVQDLLTHTSGLPMPDDVLPEHDGVPGFYQQTDPKFTSAAYVTRTYLSGDLKTTPGETFRYNNGDYILLAAVMERVTGRTYGQLLQERILSPLKMRHTGLITNDAAPSDQAVGYVSDTGKITPEPYFHIANFGAAGAMYSTVSDMLLWDNALDSDRLLKKPFREIMFTPVANLGYEALSTWVYPGSFAGVSKKPLLLERDGAIGAFNTLNLRAPDDDYSVIIFSNVDSAKLGAIYMRQGMAYDLVRALYLLGEHCPRS